MGGASNELSEIRHILASDDSLEEHYSKEVVFQRKLQMKREEFKEDILKKRLALKNVSYRMLKSIPFELTPHSMNPVGYASLLLAAAKATGVERKEENTRAYLNRALRGKNVCVIGSRFGALQKVFELFGANTYGVDTDRAGVDFAKREGLEAAHGSAEEIDRLFSGKRPDFIVSYQFFDPRYWESERPELMKKLEDIQRGISRHSTNKTIQIHDTIGPPTKFHGTTTISTQREENDHVIVILKKMAIRRQVS
ncbi:MAG: hypothetical protein V1708_00890 [Candidatus Micrarchaeota archaeon]